ncbi:hypothetical protein ACFUEJ_22695 [Gordonia sp. NPDC057258]|uniref:hypothetical protein n=1 Tax=unclassified Gordonia (in: high G+C Gram-positive bacteria) TaxID=2657482 RepID=UPI003628E331
MTAREYARLDRVALSESDPALARSLLLTGFLSIGLVVVLYGIPIVGPSLVGAPTAYVASVFVTCSVTVMIVKHGFPHFVMFWSVLALSQNSLCGLWASPYSTFIPFVATEQKTLSLAVAVLASAPTLLTWVSSRKPLLTAAALYGVVVAAHSTSVTGATLPYLRNFLLPIAGLLAFAALASRISWPTRIQTLRSVTTVLGILMATGVVLELAFGTRLWRQIVRTDINGALNSLSDATAIFGVRLPRIGGFMVEPTNAGYVAAATIIVAVVARMAWVQSGNRPYSLLIVVGPCLFALVASGAKSGFLMLAIAAMSGAIFSVTRSALAGILLGWAASLLAVWAYILAIGVPATPRAVWLEPTTLVGGDSTTFHFAGLWAGIRAATEDVIGHGVGTGGNFSRDPNEPWSTWLGTGSESAWGVLAYQTGFFGILLFCIVLVIAATDGGKAVGIIVTAWSSAAMFAEAISGPLVAGVLMMGAGLLYRSQHTDDPDHVGTSPLSKPNAHLGTKE